MSDETGTRYLWADMYVEVPTDHHPSVTRYGRGLRVPAGDQRTDSECVYDLMQVMAAKVRERGATKVRSLTIHAAETQEDPNA